MINPKRISISILVITTLIGIWSASIVQATVFDANPALVTPKIKTTKQVDFSAFANVKSKPYSAIGNGTANDSAAVQKAMNSSKNVYFPTGTYVVEKLKPQPGTTVIFGSNVVLKLPKKVSAYSWMIGIGEANAKTLSGPYRLTGPVTLDLTGQSPGKQLKGIVVWAAKNFEISAVNGINIPDGYAIQVSNSWGKTRVISEHGSIRNVSTIRGGWGAVAITAGKDIVIEDIQSTSEKVATVNLEPDDIRAPIDTVESITINRSTSISGTVALKVMPMATCTIIKYMQATLEHSPLRQSRLF